MTARRALVVIRPARQIPPMRASSRARVFGWMRILERAFGFLPSVN